MKKIKLLLLRFFVTWRNCCEYLKVIFRYYSNSLFRDIDIYLLRHYIFNDPYQICKKYLQEKGVKEIYSYGETPLTSLEIIAQEVNIQPQDVFFELGSGRGRGCFWMHCFKKCRVVGVEIVPDFVKISREVAHRYKQDLVSFIYKDMLQVDFSEATVIYFYGTCSDSSFIEQLIEKLTNEQSQASIITISYPLSAYSKKNQFNLIKTFSVNFTWGKGEVYVQKLSMEKK